MDRKTHLFAADILRGVAIAMVVVYHIFGPTCGWSLPWHGWLRDFSAPPTNYFIPFYPASFGWAGVSLFFVLSGFCIQLSFLRSPSFSYFQFFWHRFWRIVPAYFIALIAFCFLIHLPLNTVGGLKQFFAHALFIHDFRETTFSAINPSFWSIATEAQLYMMFPLLLFIRQKFGMGGCLYFTFFIGILWKTAAIFIWGLPDGFMTPAFSSPLSTWFDWTLGAYVADRLIGGESAFAKRRIWLTLLLPFFVASTLFKPTTVFSFTLAAIISAIVLDGLLWSEIPKTKLFSLIGFMGTVSYSLYLWHQPLLFRINYHLNSVLAEPLSLPLTVAVIFGFAVLSFHLLERGGLRLGAILFEKVQTKFPLKNRE